MSFEKILWVTWLLVCTGFIVRSVYICAMIMWICKTSRSKEGNERFLRIQYLGEKKLPRTSKHILSLQKQKEKEADQGGSWQYASDSSRESQFARLLFEQRWVGFRIWLSILSLSIVFFFFRRIYTDYISLSFSSQVALLAAVSLSILSGLVTQVEERITTFK